MFNDLRYVVSSKRLTPQIVALIALPFLCSYAAVASTPTTCPAVPAHDLTPAETAYNFARYEEARQLYSQLLAENPHDINISAALVHTLLHQGSLAPAAELVSKAMAQDPNSAVTLTALAELQLRQGQPWLSLDTLNSAAAADPCYARIHLIRSRVLRIDSMYASERAEVQAARAIDPYEPDIRRVYMTTLLAASDIEGTTKSLATMKDLDPASRLKAEESIRSLMPLLSENNQTCKVLPTTVSVSFPLQPSMQDGKHIDGYRLEVDMPKGKARLQVDTAASGLFISRAMANLNGFESSSEDPPGTVRAESIRIGPLEFRNCTVGVSEEPFAGKSDGFIGTDMFAQWLITLDQPQQKLTLAPLPAQAGVIPGDRVNAPELKDFMPVYHRQQYLMLPVTLNNKTRQLFILDSGIRFSTMTSEVAHQISTTKVNFTNSVQTVSGDTLQIYRDSFDFQLASLSLNHQSHILMLNPEAVRQNTGMEVAGMLGFDMLHSMVMHLDYRDGMVKLEPVGAEELTASIKGSKAASQSGEKAPADCPTMDDRDRSVNSTVVAAVTGLVDSAHLKAGKEITLKVGNNWESTECSLPLGSILYGHVTAANASKGTSGSELAFVFDQADCDGRNKRPVPFQVIGIVGSPDQYVGLHNAIPSEVRGGGRDISVTAANMGAFALDENLNPGGPPKTVHPGVVVGLPTVKLEPQGGPGCSSRLTSSGQSVKLGVGAELILTMLSKQ